MFSRPTFLFILVVSLLFPYVRLLLTRFGVFREVQDYGMDGCKKLDQLRFCESLHIERDNGLVFFSCEVERMRWNPVMGLLDESVDNQSGKIWVYDMVGLDGQPYPLKLVNFVGQFHPLGMTVVKHPHEVDTLLLYVVNLRTAARVIEIFKVGTRKPQSMEHIRSIQHELINSPNDIHVDLTRAPSPDGLYSFYVSNDHGYENPFMHNLETKLGLPFGSVAYYNTALQQPQIVAKSIAFPNGITLGNSHRILFVASTFGNAIFGYHVESSESEPFPQLRFNSTLTIPVDMSVDNLDLEPTTGELYAAGHPKALKFLQHVRDRVNNRSPSKVVRIIDPENEARVEPVFSDSGANFGTSSGAAVDHTRNIMFVAGLYEDSVLMCST
ncbi:calcium-dependent phosphotriesterase [Basidiobolus meristosporus CBS 931.73]|uniref:Calcium-dependent phosphotriesterase n=1 Tax=Basidiobolus meristosporus CBS 931.73 TaxID=1314790 RepID=A0A1Y1WWL1_9FUNG|nr:calcium-dependent phosphotriesterase [Basidiobolus meristosporus CBS 931.73]|eukprot:ORX77785.1 calcium-dependent phosphotriesterase [Basidiobolus meristosporus CBS 931.73]